ncbi:MAG: hypothetical protein LLG08_11240 [Actinomycetia bacterium]|nr:hypothetical protein [Actinomycetes bacterium]
MSVAGIPGVLSADVNFASGLLTVDYDPRADPRSAVVALVHSTGHGVEPLDKGAPAVAPPSWWEANRTTVAMVASGAFIALGWALHALGAPVLVATALYALAIASGGAITWRRAFVSVKARMLDMNVLMSVAVIGAAAIGQWQEGATVIFLFALGGWLESRSLERTRSSIRDLLAFEPAQARVVRAGRQGARAAVRRPLLALVHADGGGPGRQYRHRAACCSRGARRIVGRL